MADLTHIFGGPWSPPPLPPEKRIDPPETQLRDAMIRAGLHAPDQIILDGNLHRFASGTKGRPGHGDKSGWYVAYGDGVPAGAFGCWRSGIEVTWKADVGRQLTMQEHLAQLKRLEEAKRRRDAERQKAQEVAANSVDIIWSNGVGAAPDHPYLQRKGIGAHGARVTGDGRLMVPLFNADGRLCSLQYIDADGEKRYHAGGETGGAYWWIGAMEEGRTVYLAEGFATAATIHEVTGQPVVVAYSASNLVPVAGMLREQVKAPIVIVADHDASGVGQRYAEQASAKHGVRFVVPPMQGDANDYRAAGHDLAALLAPPATDWLIPADTFSEAPAPLRWQIKRWIQAEALIMVHGPSGGGKTFLVLDWVCSMAGQLPEWFGHKIHPGPVVYLAGEGHHGLRGRVAAWKHHHQVKSLQMWLSREGCDLNTPEGYLRVVDNVRALPQRPVLIVVDTLHRFLAGDENSAQDAKTMLDACGNLMREFSCSVLMVHHTGVSDEAQHRARGSSAWRGALDIEISVVPAKDDDPMQIIQRKSKDAELAPALTARLQAVEIPGWFDEDGEAVTSAVLVSTEGETVAAPRNKGLEKHRRMFENAWWFGGAQIERGLPYLARNDLMRYLMEKVDMKEASAKLYCKPAAKGKVICELILSEMIESTDGGWLVIDPVQASAMMIRKNED